MADYKGYEQPAYTVERRDGDFEIRRYAPHLVAEVTVEGDRSTAANRGFRVLAGYIFGANTASSKVAMTVPVTQAPAERIAMTVPVTQSGGGRLWTVRFAMPSAYTADTLPRPKDDRIRFLTTPPARMAVVRFSGIPTQAALAGEEARLRAWLAAAGLAPEGAATYQFYDAPFTLPWKRRNEVALALR